MSCLPSDPPRRKDGMCAHCRKKPAPDFDPDPFCSSTCCRSWHGLDDRGMIETTTEEERDA